MLNEIRDGWSHFIDRLKSPFGGTFIFIWIITHWEFIYYLIFVSSDVTAEERIINFKFFFQGSLGKRFILDVLQPALLTFLAIATYHIFSILAGVITVAFKRYLEPWISDELGTGPTVLKSELDLESQRLMKLQLELTKCQDLRNDESRRNLGSEQELKSSINVYLGQLNNANAKINDIENRLKILSEGDNKQLSDLHYKQRLKELRCLDFRNDRHPGLRDIMKDKKYNFYFDDVTKSFNRESFNLDDSSIL
ncbi:MAG: hypothetical protein IPG39_15280 [Bacteroidetes bacterium]|nr:hypothetical protein [Bacteroidota bacterium]